MEILEGVLSLVELVCEIAFYSTDLLGLIDISNKNSGL